jgi:signal transduction histidine kinase
MKLGRRCSITTRITLFTGVVVTLLSAIWAVTLLIAFHRYATASLTEEITAAGGRVASQVERHELAPPFVRHPDRNLQVVDPRRVVVASTPQVQGKPPMAGFTPGTRHIASATVCGGAFPDGRCDIVVAQTARRSGQDWVVYSSAPRVPAYVDPLMAAVIGATAALLAATMTCVGHRIVTSCLKPVNDIRAELDRINENCPERRVPFPQSHDEIHALAESVNQTLARLQAAMRQQRQFTSDASHDLRSPIAAMRAEVEDALLAPEETTVPKVGNAIMGSLERLERTVTDLLSLAQQDEGNPLEREPVDLAELVTAECDRPWGTDKHVECRLEPDVVVNGDWERLSRLLTNLIANAERHAASTITLHVRRMSSTRRDAHRFPDGIARLEVLDDGPGIDPDKRELVFHRFARLDAARNKDTGGAGLGLAIARQIAEAHGGTLQIEDCPKGTRFVLCLPLMPGGGRVGAG